jgi:PepSY-associated TM region
MAARGAPLKRSLIFLHRWLGVALCVLFILWFPSGFVMMYWDYPEVGPGDRLDHSPALDPAQVKLTPEAAFKLLEWDRQPDQVRLNSFDGRPVYRFRSGRDEGIVYADTGAIQDDVTSELMDRVAAAWSGQAASSAAKEQNTEEDQWTVAGNFRALRPLIKYSFADGQQVYVSEKSGEVVQATTRGSRIGAYFGAIPHWMYFTPLRKHGPQWSKFVTWTSGIGTVSALLGIVVGVWMYSPRKRYRYAGAPSSIPYRGQKRWHTIFGLIFGLGAVTWAFSGMLSMEPFPLSTGRPPRTIPAALRGGRFQLMSYMSKSPAEALRQIAYLKVKELEFASFDGEAVYLASSGRGETHLVPVEGAPATGFDTNRVMTVVKGADATAELSVMNSYDAYYLDRHGERPLPVILARLSDPEHTRFYIDPKTARVVGSYSSGSWMNRWLYHGLHSLDFPWLYRYRPLWDVVVIMFMAGGTALCVTSLILAWRVLRRKIAGMSTEEVAETVAG